VLLILAAEGSLDGRLAVACGGAYVVAWLAGLLTPGSPAGMGVREIALLALLGSRFAEADLLMAVVVSRGITLAGDVGFFAWALLGSLARRGRPT
jgi:hypothetical protein